MLRRGCSALTSHLLAVLPEVRALGLWGDLRTLWAAIRNLAVRRGPSRYRRSRSSSLAASVAIATRLPPVIKIKSGANERRYASLKHQYEVPGICSHDPQRQYLLNPGNVICTLQSRKSISVRFFLQHCRRHLAVDRKRFWHLGFTRATPPHSFSMHMAAFYTRDTLVYLLPPQCDGDSSWGTRKYGAACLSLTES